MSNRFWLTRAQLARIAPLFPARTGYPASMISASSPASFTLSAAAGAGAMRPPRTVRTRHFIIASCAGAGLASSTASSQGLSVR